MSWKAWAMIVLFVLIAGPVGVGVYMARQFLPWVGLSWLIASMVAPGILLSMLAIYAARFFFRTETFDIGPSGTVEKWFGRKAVYAPLTPTTPKAAGGTVVTEIAPEVPRLAEMIESGALVREEEGRALMFQGARMDGSFRYGEWPGVIGVAGMQNVGKSVTIETLAIIALMQYARVVVCDTHYMKARSLYKKLQALEGHITFAKTEKEVLREAENFSRELASRKSGSDPFPYVFILDEAASVIRSDIGEQITTIIEEASQEGHGFHLHLVLAIHDFSKEGIGDARVRDFLNWIYCHRMQAGQSKFIAAFNTPKNKKIIAGLPAGHTVTKDEVNEVEYLIMPFADSKDALLVRRKLEALGERSPRSQLSPIAPNLLPVGEHGERVNELPEPGEQVETFTENESFTSHSPDVHREHSPCSPGEEAAILNAAMQLQEQGKVTRTGIMNALGWNRKQWYKIQFVCDLHHIAEKEGAHV